MGELGPHLQAEPTLGHYLHSRKSLRGQALLQLRPHPSLASPLFLPDTSPAFLSPENVPPNCLQKNFPLALQFWET